MATEQSKGGKVKKVVVDAAVAAVLNYEPEVIRVHVSLIDDNPLWNTTRQDEQGLGDLSVLKGEIRAEGQRVPIEAARTGERFRCAAGFRRCGAIKSLHKAGQHDGYVLVRVLTSSDPLTLTLANVKENEDAGRLPVTWLGRSIGYQALVAAGLTTKQVAERVGRAEDVVRDALRFAKADPRCRAAVVADALGRPVPVAAPVYTADGKPKVDKQGQPVTKDVEQPAVPWGIVRLVMRKSSPAEQAALLDKVEGLSVRAAVEVISGKAEEKEPAKKEPAKKEGPDAGGGEGGEDGPDDAVVALRTLAAEALVPPLNRAEKAREAALVALKARDLDGVGAALVTLLQALQAASAGLVKVTGADLAKQVAARTAE